MNEAAWKVAGAATPDLVSVLKLAWDELTMISTWAARFDKILLLSRLDSSTLKGRVWQDRFVRYFEEAEPMLARLAGIDEKLVQVYLASEDLGQIANEARAEIAIPRKAQIEYAISDIDFGSNPNTGKDGISYSISKLNEWGDAVAKWVSRSRGKIKGLTQKAERIPRAV